MRKIDIRKHHAARGQSTTEFMLMIPVIFAVFFFVIEMGLYFSSVHYANYATYVTARSLQVNLGSGAVGAADRSAGSVADLVLTGSVFRNNYTVTQSNTGRDSSGIKIELDHWITDFPYLAALMPNMPFSMTVNLGPNEYLYEQRARDTDSNSCVDTDVDYNQC